MIKIIIADDHKIFREGLKELLGSYGKYDVIAEAANGVELIELIAGNLPDIILLDIFMPLMDGFKVAEIIRSKYPSVKVLVLSMQVNTDTYNKMLKEGVKGYILKESASNDLETALDEIYRNGSYFPKELLNKIIP